MRVWQKYNEKADGAAGVRVVCEGCWMRVCVCVVVGGVDVRASVCVGGGVQVSVYVWGKGHKVEAAGTCG